MSEENKNRENPPKNSPNNFMGNNPKPKFNMFWIWGIIAFSIFAVFFFNPGGGSTKVSWTEFKNQMVANGDIEKVVIVNEKTAEIYLKSSALEKYQDRIHKKFNPLGGSAGPHFEMDLPPVEMYAETLQKIQIPDENGNATSVTYETRQNYMRDILGLIWPILLIVIIWMVIFRRMSGGAGGGGGASNIFNVGKSKAKLFDKESNVKTDFTDVAGLEEAKVEVMEIVEFLKHPKKFTELGGKIPKGALLVGPPGTGKTLLAKAVAGEANVPFFSMSGSDFVEMFVGVGASRVRDLFKQAKEKAPCIVFIDEIDAIGRARGKNPNMGANDERENTLNQLLTEMDGFGTNVGVIILAATNRADILDRALLRAGRFDRQIHVELPDLNERKEIFKVHLKPLKLEKNFNVDFMAKQTPGFSGADIANVCNEAALIAARKNKKSVQKQDFLDAVDRIIGGLERKNKIISTLEKRTIAFHEAGHATISWLLEHANPLVKVTIIPRGKALGAAWYLPEERQITTTEQMLDEMCSALGGRASEDIIFKRVSTGALNDLERVTKQAYAMVSYFGMSDEIGNISFYDSSGQNEWAFNKPYSEKTAEVIDKEVSNVIENQYNRAKEILTKNIKGLTKLAELLLEKEVIFSEDLEEIFGQRKASVKEEKPMIKSTNGNGQVTEAKTKTTTKSKKDETKPKTTRRTKKKEE